MPFQKTSFFFASFNKDYTFYTKNLFFTTRDAQSIIKNQVYSYIFTFLSVIRQNFECNQRILANFSVKTQKSMDFAHTFSKNYSFFFFLDFLIKIILFTLRF